MVLNILMEDTAGENPTIDDAADWADYFGLTYDVLADTDRAWMDTYVIPEGAQFGTYIVDRDGVVVYRELTENLGTDDRAIAHIEEMLAAEAQ